MMMECSRAACPVPAGLREESRPAQHASDRLRRPLRGLSRPCRNRKRRRSLPSGLPCVGKGCSSGKEKRKRPRPSRAPCPVRMKEADEGNGDTGRKTGLSRTAKNSKSPAERRAGAETPVRRSCAVRPGESGPPCRGKGQFRPSSSFTASSRKPTTLRPSGATSVGKDPLAL